MNEETNIPNEETQTNILETEKIENSLEEVNQSINNLLNFFELDKQEKEQKQLQEIQNQKKEQEEIEKEQEIIDQEQEIIDQEQEKLEEEQQKEKEEFILNIETIAQNSNSEVTNQLLSDVSNLMQVNIISIGLLLGILSIILFAKFFNR